MANTKPTDESKVFMDIYPNGFSPYRIRWFDIAAASIITLIVLIMYILTLAPSVIAGDSGELTTEIYQMGACHPPGYPLYGILGKLFTFLPVGDIAYRVNLYVAVCGAFAIFLFYLVAVKLLGFNRDTGKPSLSIHLPAVVSSLIFAFSYDFWQQSSASGKFYSLNVLLVAAMLFVMILWYEEIMAFRNENNNHFAERMTILLAFIMGLSLTDHMLPMWFIAAFLFMLAFAIYVLIKDGSLKFKKEFAVRIPSLVALAGLVFVSLILLYCYMVAPRLIYAQHMPLILIGWFLVPAFLSVYTILIKIKKYSGQKFVSILYGFIVLTGITAFGFFCNFVYNNQTIPVSPQYQPSLFGFEVINENGIPQQISIDPIWIYGLAIIVVGMFLYGLYDGVVKKTDVEFGTADKFIEILTYSGWMFIFAMTLYLYLMVRNIALAPVPEPKPQSWGDTVTLDILFNHMFRKQYGGRNPDYANLGGQIMAVLKVTLNQFNWAAIIFAIAGFLYFLLMRDSIWATYTLLAYVISYAGLIYYINFQVDPATISTQKQYFSQLHMIIALYMSFGFQLLLDIVQGRIKQEMLPFFKKGGRV